MARTEATPDSPGRPGPAQSLVTRAVRFRQTLIGFPRHLSQHVGGFVLTRDKLDWTVPIGPAAMDDRYFIEWDKDDLDTLKIMKVDVLALGMLTCIRKAFDLIRAHERRAEVSRSPPCPRRTRVYEMLCRPTPSACSRWKAAPR